jgi:hypothetical protein
MNSVRTGARTSGGHLGHLDLDLAQAEIEWDRLGGHHTDAAVTSCDADDFAFRLAHDSLLVEVSNCDEDDLMHVTSSTQRSNRQGLQGCLSPLEQRAFRRIHIRQR